MMTTRIPKKTDYIYVDSCAIDSIRNDESWNNFFSSDKFTIYSSPSINEELKHPNTPEATNVPFNTIGGMFPTKYFTDYEGQDMSSCKIFSGIYKILKGNSQSDKHLMDSKHVYSTAINDGFFITTDKRIIKRRGDISSLLQELDYRLHSVRLGAAYRFIFKPCEFIELCS